jgi:endonuclease/exonuclease/phosphatase family metal-dependent hydrolase
MRLATFNIYWLGGNQIQRTKDDLGRIAQVIAKLDADVLAFQEIVGVAQLQTILDQANTLTAREYKLFDANQKLLGAAKYGGQKVVVTYDAQRYELVAAAPISGGGKGLAFGLRLKGIVSGGQVTVVGVHLKSGQPSFTDLDSATKRTDQCQYLQDWVAGNKPVFPAPLPGEHVVILGDFNALYRSDNCKYDGVVRSLDPLREGPFADWWWQDPLADPAGGDRTTVYVERLLIDYVMLSPSLKERILKPPTIYAFDLDPEIGVADERLSDHRPVVVEVDISPQ